MPNEATIVEYIKIQWADIHHSRRQVWQALVVVAGMFAVLVQFGKTQPELVVYLAIAGALVSGLAASMCRQHRAIMMQKIAIISGLEKELGLGIRYPKRTTGTPVQDLLFMLFGITAAAFVAVGLGSVSSISALAPIAAVFVLVISYLRMKAPIVSPTQAQQVGSSTQTQQVEPFYAALTDVRDCLIALDETPVKMIVERTLDRPNVKEREWMGGKWSFSKKTGEVIKDVLVNPGDTYQFSIAGKSSKQDRHFHTHVFEIYVSQTPMSLKYGPAGGDCTNEILEVDDGVIFVPPGIPHQISLSGLTFVFQISTAGEPVGTDKNAV